MRKKPSNTQAISILTIAIIILLFSTVVFVIKPLTNFDKNTTNGNYISVTTTNANIKNTTITNSAWFSTAAYPASVYGLGCNIYDNYIYCLGSSINDSYYAQISGQGIRNWIRINSYPQIGSQGIGQLSCFVYNSSIYCANGMNNTITVEYAALNQYGIGAWTQISQYRFLSNSSYNFSYSSATCFANSGYIYCIANSYVPSIDGQTPSFNVSKNSSYYLIGYAPVYYAEINSTGIGVWKQTTAYPDISDVGLICVTNSSYVYCNNGYLNPAFGPISPGYIYYSKSTYYAKINLTGISIWNKTASYPTGSGAACTKTQNRMLCISTNSSYYGNLTASGINKWLPSTEYPNHEMPISCVSNSNYTYCIGGKTTMYYPEYRCLEPCAFSTYYNNSYYTKISTH